jgi:hypothetical protein
MRLNERIRIDTSRFRTMLDDLKNQLGSSMKNVRRFLERPITLVEGNVTLGVSQSSLRAQAREEKRRHERLMKRDLYQLLEQHPSSRQLLRYLDLVERTLRRGGLDALEDLPVRVIAKALHEMERLVWDWSSAGLAELRSRLAVMVKTRPLDAQREAANTAALELDEARRADVSEVDHAMYEEMERSWTGVMPLAREPGAA